MIPVHIKSPKSIPPTSTHYVVAKNGLFLNKQQWWVKAVVPVDKIAVLEDESASAELLLPPLNAETLVKALKLAHEIYVLFGSEVCLLLHYKHESGYLLTVPKQMVGSAYADYEASERLEDYCCIGTIHSHGYMPAFHSGTDHADEEYGDGVHATLGNVNSYPHFTLSAEMVVNGNRFPIPLSWFEGVSAGKGKLFTLNHPSMETWKAPQEWVDRVFYMDRWWWEKENKQNKKRGEIVIHGD